MKKKLIVPMVLACIVSSVLYVLVSCSDDTVKLSKSEYNKLIGLPKPEFPKPLPTPDYKLENYTLNELQVVVIDSCEYILGSTGSYHGGIVLAHKGNCKFCKTRNLIK